jgi:hypothetical protein
MIHQLHGSFCFWIFVGLQKSPRRTAEGTPPGFFLVRLDQNQNLLMDLVDPLLKGV